MTGMNVEARSGWLKMTLRITEGTFLLCNKIKWKKKWYIYGNFFVFPLFINDESTFCHNFLMNGCWGPWWKFPDDSKKELSMNKIRNTKIKVVGCKRNNKSLNRKTFCKNKCIFFLLKANTFFKKNSTSFHFRSFSGLIIIFLEKKSRRFIKNPKDSTKISGNQDCGKGQGSDNILHQSLKSQSQFYYHR